MKPINQFLKEKFENARDIQSRQSSWITRPIPMEQHSQPSFTSTNSIGNNGFEQDSKNHAVDSIKPINSNEPTKSFHSYRTPVKGNPWTPGIKARAPWGGLSALLGTFLFLYVAVVIVVHANGHAVDQWPHFLQPSVLLSVNYGMSSVLLSFGLAVGVDVSFWRRAMKGTTLPVSLLFIIICDFIPIESFGNGGFLRVESSLIETYRSSTECY